MSFPNTRWTLIQELACSDGMRRGEALSVLCRDYWRPVYAFLRCSGRNHEDAEDSCQGFFAHLLGKDLFASADHERGRLRNFLLAALENFLANEYRVGMAEKRGGGERPLTMEHPMVRQEVEWLAATGAGPAEAFDNAWLGMLLDEAVKRIRGQYEAQGKGLLFAALFPALVDQAQVSQDVQAAAGLSVSHFRVQLHRLRARYRRVVIEELAATLGEGLDPEVELGGLFSILRPGA